MNLKEQLQDIVASQKEMQKLTLDGIKFKKYEEKKFINYQNIAVKRQFELQEEYKINQEYIQRLEDIIKEL